MTFQSVLVAGVVAATFFAAPAMAQVTSVAQLKDVQTYRMVLSGNVQSDFTLWLCCWLSQMAPSNLDNLPLVLNLLL
jgi:hypothetical protein